MNLVHTYIAGATFKNIFNRDSPAFYGQITHVKTLSFEDRRRWPYLKGRWVITDQNGFCSDSKTLKEAKTKALKKWPNAVFVKRKVKK